MAYELWQCASCDLLNYHTKSSRCQSCFKTKRVDIEISEGLQLCYQLLDQTLLIITEYLFDKTNIMTTVHMMITFPFYQRRIYSKFMKNIIDNISLQNLPDYRIDFNSSTYGYKRFDFDTFDNITIKQCLLTVNQWESNNEISNQLNNDLNQMNIKNETEDTFETINFFQIDGLNALHVFDMQTNEGIKSEQMIDIDRLNRLFLVVLFKDDKQPINKLDCYGMNSILTQKYDTLVLNTASIIVVKNKNMSNVFVYRAVKQTYQRKKKPLKKKKKVIKTKQIDVRQFDNFHGDTIQESIALNEKNKITNVDVKEFDNFAGDIDEIEVDSKNCSCIIL